MTKHKHAELIKQWADGATIQYRRHTDDLWEDTINTNWENVGYFRIKPPVELIDEQWYLVENTHQCNSACVLQYCEELARFSAHDGSWWAANNVTIMGTVEITML